MNDRYIPLALTEDQCQAVVAACGVAVMNIQANPEMYDRTLVTTGRSTLELMGLYTSIVMYVTDKIENK